MPIAAVPKYLGENWATASPGMKFGLYLPLWNADTFQAEKTEKRSALDKTCTLSQDAKKQLQGVLARQSVLARSYEKSLLSIEANSVAPFTTGLGNEHPLENGFSFLNPYGLPYLAGSGVKGVLRQAARELAGVDCEWELESDWSEAAIDALFGKEDSDDAQRGALQFWDVIPDLERLQVEVMTAHQSHYYQEGKQPHDSGDPNPLNFLTVPPKTNFHFHIVCDQTFLRCLAPELELDDRWKNLLSEAFEHAFEWLGFGAKTAVGYGAMRRDHDAEKRDLKEQKNRQKEDEKSAYLATLSPLERDIEKICAKEKINPAIGLLKKLNTGEWNNREDQRVVANKIRTLWQEEKNWNPDFSGKNKNKVKQKKRCKEVLSYLNDG